MIQKGIGMGSIKRIVSTSFWEDSKVVENFSPEDKYFFLYLLTNPHTTQLGIYSFIPKTAAFELGYSEDTVKVLLERFETKYGLIKFSTDTSEVAIKNYLRHSIVSGGKPVMDCLLKEEKQVKDKSLLLYIYNSIKDSNNLNTTVEQYIEHIKENDNERIVHESSKSHKFKPPAASDVEKYCIENEYFYVDPDDFVNFYASKNWMVGKNKMSSWKSAVAGWNNRARKRDEPKNKTIARKSKEYHETLEYQKFAEAEGWT